MNRPPVFGPRKKRRFVNKGLKFGTQMTVGMQGILIYCSQHGRDCVSEACGLLTEYGDLLYGPEKKEEEEEDDEGESAQTVPEKRIKTEEILRRFHPQHIGSSNIFMRTCNVEPEKLVHHILKDLYTTKQMKTQFLLRMLPFSGTCNANPEDLRKYAETFFQPWFKAPKQGNFQIIFKARCTLTLNRTMVVDELPAVLHRLNPRNRFDLINPDYTIVVDVLWNVCCLGVVKDYDLFKQYNLQEVIKSGEEGKK
ncbi:THUMP domain-containing protein 1-like [Bufo bufo]|uniref:THUMP domain-containing protein 1-like n=1 Tax=Bufo bufo TaxID=8384 RepID=UPI001ABED4E1|nr:THUMP domain-containing protein 1-like [Bufo bufo]